LFGELINGAGLSTIRVYGLQNQWKDKFDYLNDKWTVRFSKDFYNLFL
jgi:hypothetical protein